MLVCSASEGDRRATLLYTGLVGLTSVIVPLSAVLNLAVVITILLNRKLYTVINVLVSVLGINNFFWTGLPILMTVQAKVQSPALCQVRAMLFIITRGVSFIVIVIITLLRYLMVVRNHSYPAGARNVILFVSVTVLPPVVKWAIRQSHEIAACHPIVARDPDSFIIIPKFEDTFDLLTSIIAIIEYGGGLAVLGFCYVQIIVKAIRSRRRIQGNEVSDSRSGTASRSRIHPVPSIRLESVDTEDQQRDGAACRPADKMLQPDASFSSTSSPSPSCYQSSITTRPTDCDIPSVRGKSGLERSNNRVTFLDSGAHLPSKHELPTPVEEDLVVQPVTSKDAMELRAPAFISASLSERAASGQTLGAEINSKGTSRLQPRL